MTDKTDCIIIGGGIGGLFSGAFLAKNGMKVTVLEKNAIIGGGLQCFHRKGKIFETGMHVMGGFQENGNLHKICKYLGIYDSLNLQHVDCDCIDEIHYKKTGDVYRIASGKENFIRCMSEYFPEEAAGIRAYVDDIYELTEEVPLFYLKEDNGGTSIHSEKFTWSADRLINSHVSDPRLRELLAYLNPLYGGIEGHTPAYVHALIHVLYINGATRFIGGSQQLADTLKGVIENAGGEVLANKNVVRIDAVDKMITAVHTSDGDMFTADKYISAIHPVALLKLVPEGTFQRVFVNRLNEIPNSYSAFSLYIDLKPNTFPYIDHTSYYMEDYRWMWNQDSFDPTDWPKCFMYMTPPDPDQGKFANRLLVHCIMSFDRVKKWEHTTVGHRGEDYEKWKKENVKKILDKLQSLFPGLYDKIANIYSASPLTIRDYYNTKEGAIFGYRKDCENLIFSQLPVYTKVKNLLLTGQNINLHGMCGVPLTAIYTAEAILGVNTIVKEINDANKDI